MTMEIPAEVESFRAVAQEYCDWAERAPADGRAEVDTALRLLASLYHHALRLPGADPEDLPEIELLEKGEATLGIYKRFGALPLQYYGEVYRPDRVPPEEPVIGDLADDLMDIYVDLKGGLGYYDAGHPAQAVFHWSFCFGVHWGRHAVGALHALHCYATDPSHD